MKGKAIMLTLPGCAACLEFKPTLDKFAEFNSFEEKVYDVSASKEGRAYAKTFNVDCYPTTLFFKNGELTKVEGNVSLDFLNKNLK